MHAEVLVVGGGPIGAVSARCAAEAGTKALLVDRRDSLQRSSCCTGLVTRRALKNLGVSEDCVLREIRGVVAHAPDGRTLHLTADEPKAVVIDRHRLEMELHVQARDAGVEIRLGTEATGRSKDGIILESRNRKEQLTAKAIIGADGPRSQIAKWFGLPSPEQVIHAVQAVIQTDHEGNTNEVNVFLGHDVAPGFFAWAVPADPGQLRIGLGVTPPSNPSEHLARLLAERFPEARIISRASGLIPICPVAQAATNSVFLVGDAAGQVKPLSGGGLYPGAVCARIAGRMATRAIRSTAQDDDLATQYDSEWKSAIGREIAFGRSIRRISEMISDPELNALFAACDDPELLSFLAEHADIDRFHRLPDSLATHPSFWAKTVRLLPLLMSRESV